jgi:formate dehydrogenase iron-sulfur subunit
VMYVLHHADQPELYNDLPKDPHISPMVRTWKGFAKPLAVAAMAFAAIGSFFHYVGVGPDETDDEDEVKAAKLAKELSAKVESRGVDTPAQSEKAP